MPRNARNRKPTAVAPDSPPATTPGENNEGTPPDPQINERLAKEIRREFGFRMSQLPSKVMRSTGIVPLCLFLLWMLLIYTNHYGALGYWESFIHRSTDYRSQFTQTRFARTLGLDSPALNPYSLWRGVVVISFSTSLTYICIALLALRHELWHWKPELLERYLVDAKASFPGRHLPESWLNAVFNLYESEHAKHTRNRIQNRDHRASEDHRELLKVVHCVLRNLLVSSGVVFVMWMALLQTRFDSHNVLKLPRSMVPPLQILGWHIITDTFYYFPHSIAHTPRGSKGIHHKVLPHFLAEQLGSFLRTAHKTHHRSKANLAVAAWYCSITEQILFNIFPALVGPLVSQIIADKTGNSAVWGTHLITLYVWLLAGTATSVLAHTGFRTSWNDPGGHDEHHEYAFGQHAVNFGTAGLWDWVLGTKGTKATKGAIEWQEQRMRQASLARASKRTGIPLTREQKLVAKEQVLDYEWVDSRVED
ncbi:hypothetical protein B0H16DRAFT_1574563 [Mycena metata]|uniref:Fatty acid hydroxylase domain-containing protein n=1 Tax=Mycena metata TaxID=1033252 RepID=A0AAD7I6E7_9AGAR|nr:hypothetical protein B0H16DRAFT_1574563 [Mycena metata]